MATQFIQLSVPAFGYPAGTNLAVPDGSPAMALVAADLAVLLGGDPGNAVAVTAPRSALDAADAALLGDPGSATAGAGRAAYGRPVSTDGTNGLPAPTGIGLEMVIATVNGVVGLQDIRHNGTSL